MGRPVESAPQSHSAVTTSFNLNDRAGNGLSKVTIITHFPSPYQVELFDALAARGEIDLDVVYLHSCSPERRWQPRELRHSGFFLDIPANESLGADLAEKADLTVFNYYRHPAAQRWLVRRAQSQRPWAFWGEKLGFRSPHFLGRIYRRWALRHLAKSKAPIWGIGSWALESYQAEFSRHRDYENVSYYSELSRFTAAASERTIAEGLIRFLYSGSLIKRKGVDLLAAAFKKLALTDHRVRLCFLGDGPLLGALQVALAPVAHLVEFAGFKDWQELPSAYAGADILCAPSIHDGWGLIIPEGLAAGLPVIGTNQTGAALEFLRTGQNGWLIPAGSSEALFQAMLDATRQGVEKLGWMSRQACETVADHTLQHGAARLEAASRSALLKWR
jgi:glycosyltransferase involved in cell wall biosynthesis